MQVSTENVGNNFEDIPIFEYSDKKNYEKRKNSFSAKATKIVSIFSIVTQVGLFICSIVLNSRQTNSAVSVAQWIFCVVSIIICSFILILSATNKWNIFIEFIFKHNLIRRRKAHSKQQILYDINQENALKIFDDHMIITKNGLPKIYPLENLMTVDIVKERKSFIIKFTFKSGLKRVFKTPIPMQFLENISSIFKGLIEKDKDTLLSQPDEIYAGKNWPFIITGVVFGTVSLVLTILGAQGYINFPIRFCIFFITVSYIGALASWLSSSDKGRLLMPLVLGIMFFAISISFILTIFDALKTFDFIIALQKAPIIVFIVPFIFVGILSVVIGIHNSYKYVKQKTA